MYAVKNIIKTTELNKPFNRQRGTIRDIAIINSNMGTATETMPAIGDNNGDANNCSLKTAYSISLLMPVYKNSITYKATIISMIICFFILFI